jgi:aerobic carbon-monoxide dehydrogenase small subunit
MSWDLPPAEETRITLRCRVNGETVEREIPTTMRLLQFLREELGLTGAKEVCAEGECGACGVLMDGRVVNSCLILAVEAEGAEITTIEGIDHPMQTTMAETHAVQCGYCFPGMVISAADLIDKTEAGDRDSIRHGLAGNLCRCTGYAKILDAVELARDRSDSDSKG